MIPFHLLFPWEVVKDRDQELKLCCTIVWVWVLIMPFSSCVILWNLLKLSLSLSLSLSLFLSQLNLIISLFLREKQWNLRYTLKVPGQIPTPCKHSWNEYQVTMMLFQREVFPSASYFQICLILEFTNNKNSLIRNH